MAGLYGGLANLLFQDVLFLLLLRGGQTHGLLPLVVHHLLHHAACLPIQIGQLISQGKIKIKLTLYL